METPDPGYDDSASGDFTLVRELGRGTSSVVHLAWQRSLDRDVASAAAPEPERRCVQHRASAS